MREFILVTFGALIGAGATGFGAWLQSRSTIRAALLQVKAAIELESRKAELSRTNQAIMEGRTLVSLMIETLDHIRSQHNHQGVSERETCSKALPDEYLRAERESITYHNLYVHALPAVQSNGIQDLFSRFDLLRFPKEGEPCHLDEDSDDVMTVAYQALETLAPKKGIDTM
ncbi:hypothetical protein [Micromonospora sp. NPDC057141]|uniref:hypothetical protein n=1 Tax=Micromonospora sp. NPDC057141 TaxID=3346033 RepID=UPI003630D8C3